MRAVARYAGILPFTAYVVLGLIIPMIAVAVGAFQDPDTGAWTSHNIDIATHGVYLPASAQSIILSVLAAVIPAIFGLLIAYAISTAKGRGGAALRQVTITASGVFANFGGVPLAFLFITTLGSSGLETQWLKDIGWDIYGGGFSLYSVTGIVVVYMYFQIPLMVLVILPALEGLKPAWREAAENLGARSWGYWRFVGGPVLMPAVLGSMLLLFGFGAVRLRHRPGADQRHHPADVDPDRLVPVRQRDRRPGQRGQGARPRHGRDHRGGHGLLHPAPAEGGEMVALTRAIESEGKTPAGAARPAAARSVPVWRWVILLVTARVLPAAAVGRAAVQRHLRVRRRDQPGRLRHLAVAVGPAGDRDHG